MFNMLTSFKKWGIQCTTTLHTRDSIPSYIMLILDLEVPELISLKS